MTPPAAPCVLAALRRAAGVRGWATVEDVRRALGWKGWHRTDRTLAAMCRSGAAERVPGLGYRVRPGE